MSAPSPRAHVGHPVYSHQRLPELMEDIDSLLQLLRRCDFPRARMYFLAGLLQRRRRDATGSAYLTEGYTEEAYRTRTLEALEVLASDLADLLDQPGIEARVERMASPLFRHVIGAVVPLQRDVK